MRPISCSGSTSVFRAKLWENQTKRPRRIGLPPPVGGSFGKIAQTQLAGPERPRQAQPMQGQAREDDDGEQSAQKCRQKPHQLVSPRLPRGPDQSRDGVTARADQIDAGEVGVPADRFAPARYAPNQSRFAKILRKPASSRFANSRTNGFPGGIAKDDPSSGRMVLAAATRSPRSANDGGHGSAFRRPCRRGPALPEAIPASPSVAAAPSVFSSPSTWP